MIAYNRKKKPLGSTKLKYRYVGTYLKMAEFVTGFDEEQIAYYCDLYECCNRNRYMTQGLDWKGEHWQNGKYKGYEILNECWDKHIR